MKHVLARLATVFAKPASLIIGSLRGTTDVRPLCASFYELTLPGPNGTSVDLSTFVGRVSLVVNVASECGFTPQYAGLQALHDQYSHRGFAVLGFPSNDFGNQEPGSDEEICKFTAGEYGITFPLFAKVQTTPGPDQSPAYRRLSESGHLPAWNFYKYLIGRDGQVVAVFPTNVEPRAKALRHAVEDALAR